LFVVVVFLEHLIIKSDRTIKIETERFIPNTKEMVNVVFYFLSSLTYFSSPII